MRARFFASSFVCILLLAGVITFFIELPGKLSAKADSTAQTSRPAQSESGTSGSSEAQTGQDTSTPVTPPQVSGSIGPSIQTEMVYHKPTPVSLALPENGRVDMDYFTDALFIGDSLTQGFQIYSSAISNAHYAAYVGAGPQHFISGTVTNVNGEVVTAMDEILAASPKKVYILLGTNALPLLTDEAFVKYYNDFLDLLTAKLPEDTLYYLQGIPPVTAAKAESDPEKYKNERIVGLNEQIAAMAYTRGWKYLALPTAFADEAGVLRSDYVSGSDGIHLNAAGYEAWKEYLITHTAYDKNSPYIAGSPYITATS